MIPEPVRSDPKIYCKTYNGMEEDIEWRPGQKKFRADIPRFVALDDYRALATKVEQLERQRATLIDDDVALEKQILDAGFAEFDAEGDYKGTAVLVEEVLQHLAAAQAHIRELAAEQSALAEAFKKCATTDTGSYTLWNGSIYECKRNNLE